MISLFDFLKKKPILKAKIGEGISDVRTSPFLPTEKKPIQDILKKRVIRPTTLPETTFFSGDLPKFTTELIQKLSLQDKSQKYFKEKFPKRYKEIALLIPATMSRGGSASLIKQGLLTPEEVEIFGLPELGMVIGGLSETTFQKELGRIIKMAQKSKSGADFTSKLAKTRGVSSAEVTEKFAKGGFKVSPAKFWEMITGKTTSVSVPGIPMPPNIPKPPIITPIPTAVPTISPGSIIKPVIKLPIPSLPVSAIKPKIDKEFFTGLQFKEPTIVKLLTPQTYYSQILGLKPLVEPLELAKQEFDLAFRNTVNGVDKMINVLNKISGTTLKEKTSAKLKNIPTKAVEEMRNLLDKHEEAPASLSPEKTEIFNWFRNLNREMLKAENAVRTELDLEPIKYRKAYVRHTADTVAQEIIERLYPIPPELIYWSDKIISGKIYNPMEMQRKLSSALEALWTRDLAHATKSMVWTALKEIHLSKPLDVLKNRLGLVNKDPKVYEQLTPEEKTFYNGVRAMPNTTKKWLTDYVNQVIKGHETNLDRSVNNLVTQTGLKGLFNKVLKPFGRVVSKTPVTNFFQTTGRALIHGVLGPIRPKLIIRNKFQLVQNLALYTTRANTKGFLPASVDKNLVELLDKSLFLKTYTGVEELPTTLQGKLEKANLAAFQWSARTNAQQAMKVAYWDTKDLVTNPKYKDLNWADTERTYEEPKNYLYPSEKEKILKEMEFGASATQYHYIPMGMPEVFRNKSAIPLTRLQSWWMNHFFKFHREAIMRLFKGETGYGTKLPWTRRVGWFRYLILGGLILNTLGYERSYLLGAAPTGVPPTAQMVIGMYDYLVTLDKLDEPWAKRKNEEAKKNMYYSLKTFIPGYISYKDFIGLWSGEKNLKDYFFYTKKQKSKSKEIDLELDLDLDLEL